MTCTAFSDLAFWLPETLPADDQQRRRAWREALFACYGLPERVVRPDDPTSPPDETLRIREVEIVLPVTSDTALVWSCDAASTDDERSLFLRQDGHPVALLGWIDCHAHPYCLRLSEALDLSQRIAAHPEWPEAAIPFLLLKPFVAITTRQEADQAAQALFAALGQLGLAEPGKVESLGPAPASEVERLGWLERQLYRSGGQEITIPVQNGLAWIEARDGYWELVATQPHEVLSRLHGFDWPLPCYTIRSRTPYRDFPRASEAVEKTRQSPEEKDRGRPEFPFRRFHALVGGASG